uniref:Uncharacterized protein n=1 Tax=Eucampia antarctica TaxID=49252 RepID=A0A7S2R0J3_9STRA|mmetsp:Transcript_12071/g.11638  ORF Transcript_12071/g.11638 Transcript_12071/m.11638 type:complete len:502 (+) Transcript_12071:99-1604(+)
MTTMMIQPVEDREKKSRVRKMRDLDMLNADDLDLTNEAKGISTADMDRDRRREVEDEERRHKASILARSEDELRKGLFDEEKDFYSKKQRQQQRRVKRETFDEDGMDDFIDDDIGDQDDLQEEDRFDRRRRMDTSHGIDDEEGISAEMLATATDIFGSDYLNFMEGEPADEEDDLGDDDRKKKFRERGVGVTLGIDSDEEIEEDSSDDDDDLFREHDGTEPDEASKLKRKLERRAKRQLAAKKKAEKRKARLRRAFEPVQLVENFCTDRDDQIRMSDEPERFFDWSTPFHGGDEEEEEAMWIMGRIPEITVEFFSSPTQSDIKKDEDNNSMNATERKQRSILDSIIHALRFMHREKLEPQFIKRYRADIVTSPAVRENLYTIMDEDAEWERLASARSKVEQILASVTDEAVADEAKGAEEENILQIKEDLKKAQDKLDETLTEESRIKQEIAAIPDTTDADQEDEEDDDDLFGNDDDDDEDKEFIPWAARLPPPTQQSTST